MALETVFAATPAVGGGGKVISSPFQFLFTGEDQLRVVIQNSLAGVVVQLAGRFLQEGMTSPQAFVQTFTPSSNRAVNTFLVKLGTGFLLNCSFVVVSGAPIIGQTYVMAQIVRGDVGANVQLGGILGGYITAFQHLAYPGSPIESSIAGGGYPRQVAGTIPAPGVNIVETVPTGARWRLRSFETVLVTSAVAGVRGPQLNASFGASGGSFCQSPYGQNPGTTAVYEWGGAMFTSIGISGTAAMLPWPVDFWMIAGATLKVTCVNFDPADQFTFVQYIVDEWLEAA